MSRSPSGALTPIVQPMPSERLAEALELLEKAGAWAKTQGSIGWSANELDPAVFRRSIARGELFGLFRWEEVIGCMLLQDEDAVHWPESAPGEALYIHKLAVNRAHAGRRLGERLVGFACWSAKQKGRALVRLDTTPGSRLEAYYGRLGFVADPLGPATFAGRWLIRMARPINGSNKGGQIP